MAEGGAPAPAVPAGLSEVLVVYVPPEGAVPFSLSLPLTPGMTVEGAVRASGVLLRWPALQSIDVEYGVWGRKRAPEALVAPGERIEIYRPLSADPNDTRLRRAALREKKRKSKPR